MESQQSSAPWEEGGNFGDSASGAEPEVNSEAYEAIFKLALNGAPVSELRQAGIKMGLPQEEVDVLVRRAKTESNAILENSGPVMPQASSGTIHQEYETHQGGGNGGQIIFGLLLIIGGIAATAIDYSITDPGGSYNIWWGASIYGVIVLFKAAGNK